MVPAVESGPMTPSTEKLHSGPGRAFRGAPCRGAPAWSGWRCWESDVPLAEVQR